MLKNKKVQGVLQIGLSLVLLGWLLSHVGLDKVIHTLSNIDWVWYLPAFFLFLLNIIIRAYRWYLLLHSLNERPSLTHLTYLYFIGFFANNFIPSGFGGDVVKIASLRQSYGRGTEALSSVVMERVTGLMGSAIIALIALVWNAISHTTNIELPLALWIVILFISFGVPIAFVLVRWFELTRFITQRIPALSNLPKFDKLEQKLEQLEDTVRRYPIPILLQSLAISIPFTLSLILVQYSIARALSVDVPLAVFGLFVPIIAIVNLLPISFNGLGLREGVYLFLFGSIGVVKDSAVAMSLAFYFLRFSAGMIGGLLYALRSVVLLLRSPHTKNL